MPEPSEVESDALLRLAANTRHWRIERGLTQAELAESAGVQTQAIQVLEAAGRRPGLKLVFGVAAALGVDISQMWKKRKLRHRPSGRPKNSRSR